VENAFVESFNGRFPEECLNEHWLLNLAGARELIERWRRDHVKYVLGGGAWHRVRDAAIEVLGARGGSSRAARFRHSGAYPSIKGRRTQQCQA
jgi:hypothetical protein